MSQQHRIWLVVMNQNWKFALNLSLLIHQQFSLWLHSFDLFAPFILILIYTMQSYSNDKWKLEIIMMPDANDDSDLILYYYTYRQIFFAQVYLY